MTAAHNFTREILRALVAAPSISSHDASKDQNPQKALDVLAGFLSGVGAKVRLHGNALRPQKPVLVADWGEGSQIGAVLAGHIDTVPAVQAQWTDDPWTLREENGRWLGLGVADMKGFFAVATSLLGELRGQLKKMVRVVATSDEESGMDGMRHLADLQALPVAPTVVGEPTSGIMASGSKGINVFRVRVSGIDGHASNPPDKGRSIDAVRLLLDYLHRLEQQLRQRPEWRDERFSPPYPTLNVGRLDVGDVHNRLAASGAIDLEFRLLPNISNRECRAWLQEILTQVAAETATKLCSETKFELPAFCNHSLDSHLPRMPYACEAGFFPDHSRVCIWGPGELEQAHTADESVDIAMLMQYRSELGEWLIRNCS